MVEEKFEMTLENGEQTDQPTPSPLYEIENVENFEKNEDGADYDEEAMVEIPMELERGLVIL